MLWQVDRNRGTLKHKVDGRKTERGMGLGVGVGVGETIIMVGGGLYISLYIYISRAQHGQVYAA